MENLNTAKLMTATCEMIQRAFADPDHRDRLQAYKAKLIRQGRWPLKEDCRREA